MHASYRVKRDMPDAVGPLVAQLAAAFPACEVWLDVFDFGAARIIRLVCPAPEGRTIVIDASAAEPKLLDESVMKAIHAHLAGKT